MYANCIKWLFLFFSFNFMFELNAQGIQEGIEDCVSHDSLLKYDNSSFFVINYHDYYSYCSNANFDQKILKSFSDANPIFEEWLLLAENIDSKKDKLNSYKLFTRKSDSVNVLVPLGKTKKMEDSENEFIEQHIFKGDTFICIWGEPVCYYIKDSIEILETYNYDMVESGSYNMETTYFINKRPILKRTFDYSENWSGDVEGKYMGITYDNYDFILNNKKYSYTKKMIFYKCDSGNENYYRSEKYKSVSDLNDLSQECFILEKIKRNQILN